MTQTNDVWRPTLKSAVLNNRPAVSCSVPDKQFLDLTYPLTGQSVFIVSIPPTTAHANMILSGPNGSANVDLFYKYVSSASEISFDGNVSGTGKPTGRYSLRGGALSAFSENHSFVVSYEALSPILGYFEYQASWTFEYFMRRARTPSTMDEVFRGEMCEILVFDRALTAAEQQQVGFYLQTKYNIAGNYPLSDIDWVIAEPPDQVSQTSMRLAGRIVGLSDPSTAILRVYYGTKDGGATADWDGYAEAPAFENTVVRLPLTSGLTADTTYYYRAAVIDEGVEIFGDLTYSVQTSSFDTPARFEYVGPMVVTNWNTADLWVNLDGRIRTIPGLPGDEVIIPLLDKSSTLELLLENDITLKSLAVGHDHSTSDGAEYGEGGEINLYNANPAVPVTVTFDSGTPGAPAEFQSRGLYAFRLGRSLSDNMTLQLNSPLRCERKTDYHSYILSYSKITGGTPANPVSLTGIISLNQAKFSLVPVNPANDFVGDITLERLALSGSIMSFCSGRNLGTLFNIEPNDAYFGHITNRLILRGYTPANPAHGPRLILNAPKTSSPAFTFNRTLMGDGNLERVVQGTNLNNSGTAPLHLGPRCVLSPGEGSTVGTLSILANTLTSDDASAMRLTLKSTTNDVVVFDRRGSVTFNGRIELEPEGAIPIGKTWNIVTTSGNPLDFTCQPSHVTPGYTIATLDTGANQWIVQATYIGPPTQVLLY